MTLNSVDIAYRNAKDVQALLEIADIATNGYMETEPEEPTFGDTTVAENLRARFEAIRDRRAKEDAGERLP